jgi:hypothetical protein
MESEPGTYAYHSGGARQLLRQTHSIDKNDLGPDWARYMRVENIYEKNQVPLLYHVTQVEKGKAGGIARFSLIIHAQLPSPLLGGIVPS